MNCNFAIENSPQTKSGPTLPSWCYEKCDICGGRCLRVMSENSEVLMLKVQETAVSLNLLCGNCCQMWTEKLWKKNWTQNCEEITLNIPATFLWDYQITCSTPVPSQQTFRGPGYALSCFLTGRDCSKGGSSFATATAIAGMKKRVPARGWLTPAPYFLGVLGLFSAVKALAPQWHRGLS